MGGNKDHRAHGGHQQVYLTYVFEALPSPLQTTYYTGTNKVKVLGSAYFLNSPLLPIS